MSSDDRSWLTRSVNGPGCFEQCHISIQDCSPLLVQLTGGGLIFFLAESNFFDLCPKFFFFFACVHCVSHVFSPHLD